MYAGPAARSSSTRAEPGARVARRSRTAARGRHPDGPRATSSPDALDPIGPPCACGAPARRRSCRGPAAFFGADAASARTSPSRAVALNRSCCRSAALYGRSARDRDATARPASAAGLGAGVAADVLRQGSSRVLRRRFPRRPACARSPAALAGGALAYAARPWRIGARSRSDALSADAPASACARVRAAATEPASGPTSSIVGGGRRSAARSPRSSPRAAAT